MDPTVLSDIEDLCEGLLVTQADIEGQPVRPPSTDGWKEATLLMCANAQDHLAKIRSISIEIRKQDEESLKLLTTLYEMKAELEAGRTLPAGSDEKLDICQRASKEIQINTLQQKSQLTGWIMEFKQAYNEWVMQAKMLQAVGPDSKA